MKFVNINAGILLVPMNVKKRRKMVKEIYRPRRCEGMQEGVKYKDLHGPLLILVRVKSRDMKWAGHITGIHFATSRISIVY